MPRIEIGYKGKIEYDALDFEDAENHFREEFGYDVHPYCFFNTETEEGKDVVGFSEMDGSLILIDSKVEPIMLKPNIKE